MITCSKCGREFVKPNCYGNHRKSCHRTQSELSDLFWKQVDTSSGCEGSDCWPWKGNLAGSGYIKGAGFKIGKGYGQFTVGGKKISCHRFAYQDRVGAVPEGKWVLHRCDNPKCCRPSHLFLGDCQSNHDDMAEKGRGTIKIPKQVAIDVALSLASGMSYGKTAKKHGVSKSFVAHVAKKRSRKNITKEILG